MAGPALSQLQVVAVCDDGSARVVDLLADGRVRVELAGACLEIARRYLAAGHQPPAGIREIARLIDAARDAGDGPSTCGNERAKAVVDELPVGLPPISRREAATRLQVTPQRISQLVAAGRLGAERVAGRLQINPDDVDDLRRAGDHP
ncbi:MAG: helix-turn-helix domain-containing protein [Nitriliruptoraceae bacterium]|nr:helix-turn-helix domain-containing protein [Nitriliruptoraceae bacterium]